MQVSASKLKVLRGEHGWSQEKLAALSGLSLRTIQRIEKDGQCSVESKLALTAAFNVSPCELLEDYREHVGDGSVNIGGVFGAVSISALVGLLLAWEWHNIEVFINPMNALFVYLTVFALSMMTSGFEQSYRAMATVGWFFKQPYHASNAHLHLPVLRKLILYCYTSGTIWTLTEIVESAYFAGKGSLGSMPVSEFGFALQSMLYAVLLAEFVIRPLMNRITFLLSQREC